MIKGIEHVGLVARDVPALCEWYIRNFGFTLVRVLPNGTRFIKAADGSFIEVYPCKSEDSELHDNYLTGWRHIAFDVTDFDAEYARLKELGVEFAAAPVINESLKLILFRDPEGNLCHLTERAEPLR